MRICVSLLVVAACSEPAPFDIPPSPGGSPSQRFLHVAGEGLADGNAMPVQLRCTNLGNWLHPEAYLLGEGSLNFLVSASELRARIVDLVGAAEADAFWADYRARFVTSDDIAQLAASGLNCVRVPIDYKPLVDDPATGLAPLDDVVDWAGQHALFVILDLHAAPGGQSNLASVADVPSTDLTARLWQGPTAAANQAQLADVWRMLAQHFADAPAVGGYDLLNEPVIPTSVSPTALPAIYGRTIAAIREVDPDHLVITEGNQLARDFSAFPHPLDPNQMYSFHAYGTTTDETSVAPYVELRARDQLPLWLGEFGEDATPWLHAMVQRMETDHIGWSLWTFKRRLIDGHPVPLAFTPPAAWGVLLSYLVAPQLSRRPSLAETRAGLAALLAAIPSASCHPEPTLFDDLLAP